MYFVGYYVLHNTQLGFLTVRTTMPTHTYTHTPHTHTRTGLNRLTETTHSFATKHNFPLKSLVAGSAFICFMIFCLCTAQDTWTKEMKILNLQYLYVPIYIYYFFLYEHNNFIIY